MMTLKTQFQVFLGSIVLGMLFLFLWSLFNAIFIKYKKSIIRLPFETLFFIGVAIIYYVFLIKICEGVLNIFYPLALFVGAGIYQKFYAPRINPYLDLFIKKCKKFIKELSKPFRVLYNKIKVKTKRRKRKNEIKKTS